MIIEIKAPPSWKKLVWLYELLKRASVYYDSPVKDMKIPNPYGKGFWMVHPRFAVNATLDKISRPKFDPDLKAIFDTAWKEEATHALQMVRERYDTPGRRRALREAQEAN